MKKFEDKLSESPRRVEVREINGVLNPFYRLPKGAIPAKIAVDEFRAAEAGAKHEEAV